MTFMKKIISLAQDSQLGAGLRPIASSSAGRMFLLEKYTKQSCWIASGIASKAKV